MSTRRSFLEASARERVLSLLDPGSFREVCPPSERLISPHLAVLDLPQALDDGIVTGAGRLAGHTVLIAAQEGRFNGGAVGEVHGAKLVGLLNAAALERPAAVLLLIDSGGVRLHEANAGILAISEVARALLEVRRCQVPVIALLGGSCGAFGGMGIVTRLCHVVIMSEEGRLSLSGPEVIETVKGREEFDSRDRALVWRVTGGKTRRALGEADRLVEDDIAAFRTAALESLENMPADGPPALSIDDLRARQASLRARAAQFASARDGTEILAARVHLAPEASALADAETFEAALRPALAGLADPEPVLWGALNAADQVFVDRLFGTQQATLRSVGHFIAGEAHTGQGPMWVIGTRDHAPIGLILALQLADAVLAAVAHDAAKGQPQPILLLAETEGQALSRHDELLGLNGALGHLALCVDLARRAGHRLVTLVRNEAVSGGFLAFGMLGDIICALPDAQVRVMDLRAMARVTRIPLERLEALAKSSPVFAPGAANFLELGGVHRLWRDDESWTLALAEALQDATDSDQRSALGYQRGGRQLAAQVATRVCAQVSELM